MHLKVNAHCPNSFSLVLSVQTLSLEGMSEMEGIESGEEPTPQTELTAEESEERIEELRNRLQLVARKTVLGTESVDNFFIALNTCHTNEIWFDCFVLRLAKRDVAHLVEVKSKTAHCKAFTKCLMTHLLFLLSRHCSDAARFSSCNKFIVELYKIILSRDLFGHSSRNIPQKKSNLPEMTFLWFQPALTDITHRKFTFQHLPISFNNVVQCEELLIAMMELAGCLDFSFNVDPKTMSKYWTLLLRYLEIGNNHLKQLAFEAISHTICSKQIPDDLRWFFELVLAGKINNYKNVVALEESFSKCLNSTFVRTACNNHYYLNNISLFHFFEDFLAMVSKFGLPEIKTDILLQSMCEIILCMFSKFGKCNKPVKEKLLKLAGSALQHLMTKCEHKLISQCIFELIREEVNLNSFKVAALAHQEKRAKTSLIGSIQSFTNTHVNAASLSPTWSSFQKELQSILEKVVQEDGSGYDQLAMVLPKLQLMVTVGAVCSVSVCLPERAQLGKETSRYMRWFRDETPVLLCQSCFQLLYSQPNIKVYSAIVNIVAALLYAQDRLNISDVWPQLTAIVALPWLNVAKTCIDITSNHLRILSPTISEIVFNDDNETLELCLWSLAVLPSDVAVNVRVLIFRAILCGSNLGYQTQTLCMDVLTLMLQRVQNSKIEDMLEILEIAINSLELTAQIVMANSLGSIICILAGKTCFCRSKLDKFKENGFFKAFGIKCLICVSKDVQPILLEKAIIKPFLGLMSHSDDKVKLGMIESFKSIFRHVEVDSNTLSAFMDFMEDDNRLVRSTFMLAFPVCIANVQDVTSLETTIVEKIKEASDNSIASEIIMKQETVLKVAGHLGRVVDGELLEVIIIILVDNLITGSTIRVAHAHVELMNIAAAKNTNLTKLFTRFKEKICKTLCEKFQKESEIVQTALFTVKTTFGFSDIKVFLSVALKHMLPHVVSKGTKESSALLLFLSGQLETTKRELLKDQFKYIYTHLVCECPGKEMENALKFIESETDMKIGEYLNYDYQKLLNEVLLRISTHNPQVFNGLALLATKVDLSYRQTEIKTIPQMANFLQPRLLGFLAFFDRQLQTSSLTVEEKTLVLNCLIELIKWMGSKHITPVRMKVMATLRIAIGHKEPALVDLSCTAWLTFLQNIDEISLGPLLSQIVVPLLPVLETKPKQIAQIFNYCIVEKREVMKFYFNDLHLIPDIPELIEVNEILKTHRETPKTQEDCRNILLHSLKTISHENLEVRINALDKLKHFLRTYKDSIYELVLGSESLDPTISQLVKIMVISCRETNTRIRSLIGECLGELGAIDPERMELDTRDFTTDMTKICIALGEDFAFYLIQELARAYLAADGPRIQDCSSFAIQELLKIYKCKPIDETTNCPTPLWGKFSQLIQEILEPLLRSKYMEASTNAIEFTVPIYGSDDAKTFNDWVCTLCGFLVSKLKGGHAAMVFSACRTIIKHDFNTAMFILPYALLYALLLTDNAGRDEILQEVLLVLNHKDVKGRVNQSDTFHMSTQTVFSALDFLKKWLRKSVAMRRKFNANSGPVDDFLGKIPQDLLIEASHECQAHTRALMLCEAHIKRTKKPRRLYIALDEPDAVAGLAACSKNKLRLSDQILVHESTGQFQDALACYERAISEEPDEVIHYGGMLKTLLSLGQSSTALDYANGVVARKLGWSKELNRFRVEAAWKLNNWSSLDNFLKEDTVRCPGVAIGQILLSTKKREKAKFVQLLEDARVNQMGPLSAAGMEDYAYQRGYEYLIRLHMLNEVEKGMRIFLKFPATLPEEDEFENPVSLISQWDSRFKSIQSTFRYQEPVLSLRRVVFGLAKDSLPGLEATLNDQIGHCWLRSAKAARKSGNTQHAYSCLLEATNFKLRDTFVENAKYHWSKAENEEAFMCLKNGFQEHYNGLAKPYDEETKVSFAKAKLLLVRYSEDVGRNDSSSVITMYEEVQKIYPEWEDAYFYLAQYCDRMYNVVDKKGNPVDLTMRVAKNYSQSLKFGSHFTQHAMSRLLSVWLDLGAKIVEWRIENKSSTKSDDLLQSINRLMIDNFHTLPTYKFLTALPQLVSRICHSHEIVIPVLQKIIAKVLVAYPQQSMWQIIGVQKSKYGKRATRCQEIIHLAKTLNKDLNKFYIDAGKLAEHLIVLCNYPTDSNEKELSLSRHCPSLRNVLATRNFSQIMLPLQSAMTVNLPFRNCGLLRDANHNPFPHRLVYIVKIEDRIICMPSLVKPKKISIRASDGKVYEMLCKPKDDLRKDCRLMEFNAIVNKALIRDPEARRRELHIRTYTVVPLNEECGLLEWVPNLSSFRTVVMNLYKDRNMLAIQSELKDMYPHRNARQEVKLTAFRTQYLPRYPPVLSEWFQETYSVRASFSRTLAVMSIVGYMLGLGDRHGENIMLDNSNGDVVHVDFNCLFNKGNKFEWPELVPFRLTNNLVDALGVTGYEGVFRRACEVTMRVMRKHRESLMSVLKTFIHDPLVEWNPLKEGGAEIINTLAVTHVLNIERRIKGEVDALGPQLSVEGHVDYLIKEATNEELLCRMYLGWAAFL
uniref:Serine/threonine-protein kinase ATR n=1 Tax=Strigamia maritima TaxID=126957 RepID=T1IWR0_STRMM